MVRVVLFLLGMDPTRKDTMTTATVSATEFVTAVHAHGATTIGMKIIDDSGKYRLSYSLITPEDRAHAVRMVEMTWADAQSVVETWATRPAREGEGDSRVYVEPDGSSFWIGEAGVTVWVTR